MLENYRQAAQALKEADALLIGAGAGMGVDSGLPDFRGDAGFWKAYPMHYGRSFHELANPRWFRSDLALAWGFYGHRLKLYQTTVPHEGFAILLNWAERMPAGYFVFTSNVDGHFQKAGFGTERIIECHGSINFLQCQKPCHEEIWQADASTFDVEINTLRAVGQLPACRHCLQIARPNVLMFGDGHWLDTRSRDQSRRYSQWLKQVQGKNVVAIELGAGTSIQTVRYECEGRGSKLIRINPREVEVRSDGISISSGALLALKSINELM